ncbi:unnamed protein product [Cuscuta campestris]|uniref:Uncharacterized protein n=1 Tax=Cuscuta campestris TaxID=132261 RepID=A0A484M742_9ASTE|nr:unnamed protein product [Cuscuta campestris]
MDLWRTKLLMELILLRFHFQSPIDKAPAVILGGGNEISTDSQPTLEIGQVDDGTKALQPGVLGARTQLQPGTPGELEPEDESIKPCLLNREEQLIIDGLFKHAPKMQVSSLDNPIQYELKLKMIDANVEELARGDLQKEFEILKPIFEQHISDDFEQSLWIIKEALRLPFVIEKIQKGLVNTLQGKAIKATRDAMKSTQCIRAIKLKGNFFKVFGLQLSNSYWRLIFMSRFMEDIAVLRTATFLRGHPTCNDFWRDTSAASIPAAAKQMEVERRTKCSGSDDPPAAATPPTWQQPPRRWKTRRRLNYPAEARKKQKNPVSKSKPDSNSNSIQHNHNL